MTLTLPKGWGPATLLVVLYALAAAIGGIIDVAQGDLTYTEFIESLKFAAGATGLLAVGRGIAWGGPGNGIDNAGALPPQRDR